MLFQTLVVAFVVSYLGSIPPGTINVSVMQLSILGKHRAAIFLSVAACVIEFVYAGITVQFHIYLTGNPTISEYFKLITALALIGLGLWNLLTKSASRQVTIASEVKGRQGFLRGTLLGLLNPMTIPFWLAMTTYLENDRWVDLTGSGFWIYLLGLSVGTFVLLLTVNRLGRRFSQIANNTFLVQKVPGILLLFLGAYFLLQLMKATFGLAI